MTHKQKPASAERNAANGNGAAIGSPHNIPGKHKAHRKATNTINIASLRLMDAPFPARRIIAWPLGTT